MKKKQLDDLWVEDVRHLTPTQEPKDGHAANFSFAVLCTSHFVKRGEQTNKGGRERGRDEREREMRETRDERERETRERRDGERDDTQRWRER